MYKCNKCDFETENKSSLGGHVSTKHVEIKSFEKKEFTKNCLKCNKEFVVIRNAKFNFKAHKKELKHCSRTCANSRVWSESDKKKKSEALKKSEKCKILYKKLEEIKLNKKPIIKESVCVCCGNLFKIKLKYNSSYFKKTCSKECHLKISGGYREGSGRSKHGYYKGIYCGSTYELIWVIYQLDHNLPCERFDGVLKFKEKKYYPDFIDKNSNTIIEIKGYESEDSVNIKNNIAKENGYNILVLRKEDLTKEFTWVKNNYTYKEVYQLYDNYKPKFSYVCSHCGSKISRNYEQKTTTVFCSRSCSAKGNRQFL